MHVVRSMRGQDVPVQIPGRPCMYESSVQGMKPSTCICRRQAVDMVPDVDEAWPRQYGGLVADTECSSCCQPAVFSQCNSI